MTAKQESSSQKEVEDVLRWVDSIRESAMGHSQNEKKLICLADEVKRLRRQLKTNP